MNSGLVKPLLVQFLLPVVSITLTNIELLFITMSQLKSFFLPGNLSGTVPLFRLIVLFPVLSLLSPPSQVLLIRFRIFRKGCIKEKHSFLNSTGGLEPWSIILGQSLHPDILVMLCLSKGVSSEHFAECELTAACSGTWPQKTRTGGMVKSPPEVWGGTGRSGHSPCWHAYLISSFGEPSGTIGHISDDNG